jgi:putative MFS transporter
MLEYLDKQTRLTRNQYKIVAAAAIGDALEFFDYYLISFVIVFIIKPWQLTALQSGIILLSSGIGAIAGAYIWGYIADRIGRRTVFIATIINFSMATGILALTPDRGWIFLTAFRFFVGFGVGGLYVVDLPLVQEFMPTSKRGSLAASSPASFRSAPCWGRCSAPISRRWSAGVGFSWSVSFPLS